MERLGIGQRAGPGGGDLLLGDAGPGRLEHGDVPMSTHRAAARSRATSPGSFSRSNSARQSAAGTNVAPGMTDLRPSK